MMDIFNMSIDCCYDKKKLEYLEKKFENKELLPNQLEFHFRELLKDCYRYRNRIDRKEES